MSFADSNSSKAGAQVLPSSVLAQSSVKSSRLLNACLAAAAAFASANSTAAAMRLPFLLVRTYICEAFRVWQCIYFCPTATSGRSLSNPPKDRTCCGKHPMTLTVQRNLTTV